MSEPAKEMSRFPEPLEHFSFRCTVRDRNNPSMVETLTLEAAALDQAVARLQADGYVVISIENLSQAKSPSGLHGLWNKNPKSPEEAPTKVTWSETTVPRKSKKFVLPFVGTRELISFAIQLAALLNAGIPLLRGLKIILRGTRNLYFRMTLEDMIEQVSQGFSLNYAIARHPKVFPAVWMNLIEVGEISGTLANVLQEIAHYQEASQRIKGKVISAFFYPAILTVLASAAVTFLLIEIIPKFDTIFHSMHMHLPFVTQLVIQASRLLRNYTWVFAALFLALIAGLVTARRNPSGRLAMDSFFIKVPLMGPLLLQVAMVRFTRGLGTLLQSGIPILQSLKISAKLSQNACLSKIILDSHDALQAGQGLGPQLETSKLFPVFMTQLISVGEESGELVRFLKIIADHYEETVDTFLARLSAMLEPLLLVCVGSVIGVIVVSIFLPLMEISTGGGGF